MADVVFVAVIIAFFALSALYVTWCDRIIGPDSFSGESGDSDTAEPSSISAIAAERTEVTV